MRRSRLSTAFVLAFVPMVSSAARADDKGEIVQSDTLGMNVYSYNFSKSTATNVSDAQNLSEFIGLHYYAIDHVRLGMNLQFTEELAPTPAMGASRFRTFALLPQVGWNFHKPFFAALVLTLAPRTSGTSTFDAGFQGVFGASIEVSPRVRANIALEVPVNFVVATTIGVTPLLGISIAL
jgi:hypothetical protein